MPQFNRIFVLFSLVVFCDVSLSEPPPLHGKPLEGGEIVSIENVPYHASLLYYGWIFLCSGIIVSPRIILTAAHCSMGDPSQWLVQVGSTDNSKNGIKYPVEKIVIHEGYYQGNSDHDICLFVLKTFIPMNDFAAAIIPIVPPDYSIPDDIMEGYSTSWGATGNENITAELKAINYPFVEQDTCEELYKDREDIIISDNVICAGYTVDGCQGDSGAPLTVDCFLVGMAARNPGCSGDGLPGIWIKISAFSEWIQEWIDNVDDTVV